MRDELTYYELPQEILTAIHKVPNNDEKTDLLVRLKAPLTDYISLLIKHKLINDVIWRMLNEEEKAVCMALTLSSSGSND